MPGGLLEGLGRAQRAGSAPGSVLCPSPFPHSLLQPLVTMETGLHAKDGGAGRRGPWDLGDPRPGPRFTREVMGRPLVSVELDTVQAERLPR